MRHTASLPQPANTVCALCQPHPRTLCTAPRSGLAWKSHIDIGAGVIDADYRGNVGVILFNHGDDEFKVTKGDRVAQLILEKIITPPVVEVDDLDATVRGEGGYGSTGVALKAAAPEEDAKKIKTSD
eukprot:COSAG05_NODE_336_length_11205_cov_4.160544_1_plen_127_part_00